MDNMKLSSMYAIVAKQSSEATYRITQNEGIPVMSAFDHELSKMYELLTGARANVKGVEFALVKLDIGEDVEARAKQEYEQLKKN